MPKTKREKLVPKADRKPIKSVTVSAGSLTPTSTCGVVAGCGCRADYMVFGGDGKTMMSRLSYCTCKVHLELAVERVLNGSRT